MLRVEYKIYIRSPASFDRFQILVLLQGGK